MLAFASLLNSMLSSSQTNILCCFYLLRQGNPSCTVMSSLKDSNPQSKAALKQTVDMLRSQVSMQRIKVSVAATDLMNYCLENAKDDYLLHSGNLHGNPYKEKKDCPVM